MLGNFSCFCCPLLTFFKINFFKIKFRNTIRVSNALDSDQDRHSVGPDLSPNCLQRLTAEQMTKTAASKERVDLFVCIISQPCCDKCNRSPTQSDLIWSGWSIIYFKGSKVTNNTYIFCPRRLLYCSIVLHLGLHCLSLYQFTGSGQQIN